MFSGCRQPSNNQAKIEDISLNAEPLETSFSVANESESMDDDLNALKDDVFSVINIPLDGGIDNSDINEKISDDTKENEKPLEFLVVSLLFLHNAEDTVTVYIFRRF